MSKLETVKGLAGSGQQLQIVQAIQQLQQTLSELQSLPEQLASQTAQTLQPLQQLPEQTASSTRAALAPLETVRQQIDQMQQDLASLPEAVATETASALKVLETLHQDVTAVLKAYDQVTAHQRQSLDALTVEMASRAGQAFESKAQSLHAPLVALEGQTKDLANAIKQMVATAKQIESLPGRLNAATTSMETASASLTRAALNVQPPLWKRLATVVAVAVLAGAAGAMLPETGRAALSALVPPSAEQKELESFRAMWRKATPKERESMQQIATRPVN